LIDKNLSYRQKQKIMLSRAKKMCRRQNGCYYLGGEKLTVINGENGIKRAILVADTKSNTAEFYSLTPEDRKHQKSAYRVTYARGATMIINNVTHELTIKTNACVFVDNKAMLADEIHYNMKSRNLTVPDSTERGKAYLNVEVNPC
jgi:KaiC/GvpD/RAD55 family RecA-like ATPase